MYLGQLCLVQYFLTTDPHVGVQVQFECLGRTRESLIVISATNPSLHGLCTVMHRSKRSLVLSLFHTIILYSGKFSREKTFADR